LLNAARKVKVAGDFARLTQAVSMMIEEGKSSRFFRF
jgi:hypothetical protein